MSPRSRETTRIDSLDPDRSALRTSCVRSLRSCSTCGEGGPGTDGGVEGCAGIPGACALAVAAALPPAVGTHPPRCGASATISVRPPNIARPLDIIFPLVVGPTRAGRGQRHRRTCISRRPAATPAAAPAITTRPVQNLLLVRARATEIHPPFALDSDAETTPVRSLSKLDLERVPGGFSFDRPQSAMRGSDPAILRGVCPRRLSPEVAATILVRFRFRMAPVQPPESIPALSSRVAHMRRSRQISARTVTAATRQAHRPRR